MVERRILNSWKEIAAYLGRGVRTVQRWESHLGLPVHRPAGKDHSAVLAFSTELDQWLNSRPMRQTLPSSPQSASVSGASTVDVQAILRRAGILLEKLELLLSRTEELQRQLALTIDTLANDQIHRDLREDEAHRAIRGEAA
jgi:hypothetical protein